MKENTLLVTVFIFFVLGALLLAWTMISYIDVISHNLAQSAVRGSSASWNLFSVLF